MTMEKRRIRVAPSEVALEIRKRIFRSSYIQGLVVVEEK